MKRSILLFSLAIGLFLLLVMPKGTLFLFRSSILSHFSPAVDPILSYHDVLQVENGRLKQTNAQLLQLYRQELQRTESLSLALDLEAISDGYMQRRYAELRALLAKSLLALPAHPIAQERRYWSDGCWIDVGESDNRGKNNPVIGKNSPVVWRNCLIGMVERVFENRSWVRLLTDPSLMPAVRAVRGIIPALHSNIDLKVALRALLLQKDANGDLVELLQQIQTLIAHTEGGSHLAKGYVKAASSPQWRRPGRWLEGIGFNYEFEDQEGKARDLRSGGIFAEKDSEPIVQPGDLLVTTGMDGVFPAGLLVGYVKTIKPLKEGDVSYKLTAEPCARLEDTDGLLFVLPPTT